jgi:hypothetical protein
VSRRSAGWLAALGSFVVYLIPVFGVHGSAGIGVQLLGALYEGWTLWLVSVSAAALLLQVAAAGTLYWVFRRPGRVRLLGLVAAVPLFYLAVQVTYLWVIPVLLLVEADRAPEVGDAEVLCTVDHAGLAAVRSGTTTALETAAEAWIDYTEDRHFGVLSMPGCRVWELPETRAGLVYALVAPGGHVVFRPDGGTGADVGYYYMGPELAGPAALTPPADVDPWLPVLSDEGDDVAWLSSAGSGTDARAWRVHIRDLTIGTERWVALDQPLRAQLTLLSFSSARSEYVAYRYRNELLVFDGDGRLSQEPVRPDGTYSFRHNVRRTQGGWVAWDGYREGRERNRVVWRLPEGSGVHEVPRGRDIHSVSVDPEGRFVAVSTTRSVSVGDIQDAVFVLRTSDGGELYRRRRPAYTRTRVAFLGSEALALSPGFSPGRGIDVVRLNVW